MVVRVYSDYLRNGNNSSLTLSGVTRSRMYWGVPAPDPSALFLVDQPLSSLENFPGIPHSLLRWAMKKQSCVIILFLACFSPMIHAGTLVQVSQLADLPVSNIADVSGFPIGSTYDDRVAISTPANLIEWSRIGSTFEVDQAANNYGFTAFADNTLILFAGGFFGNLGDGGPITLTFDSPVAWFGLNIEDFNLGEYRVSFVLFHGDTALAGFEAEGNDPQALSFSGALADANIITSVVFDDSANGSNNIGFGPLSYGSVSDAPEPSTGILLLVGSVLGQRLFNKYRTGRAR